MLIALADDLGEHVEPAASSRRSHLADAASASATGSMAPVTRIPIMASRAKPAEGGRYLNDLHHAAVDQPLNALAYRRLGEPDRLADRGVRAAAVLLELLDDRLGDVVEGTDVSVALAAHVAQGIADVARASERIRCTR